MTEAAEVFISYSSRDVEKVRALAGNLEREGIRVWRDQDQILGGQIYGPKIVSAIRAAKVLLLACTDASLNSKNVRQEINLAWQYDVPCVPVLLQRTSYPEQIEYWLSGLQWIEILDRPEGDWLPKVVAALGGCIERIAKAPPRPDGPPRIEPVQPFQELWALARFTDSIWPTPFVPTAAFTRAIRDLGDAQEASRRSFALGERLQLRVESDRDGHLLLIDWGTSGTFYCLCPSAFAPSTRVERGTTVLPTPDGRFPAFPVTGRPGREQVLAIITDKQLPLDWSAGSASARHLSADDLTALIRLLLQLPGDGWTAAATYFEIRG